MADYSLFQTGTGGMPTSGPTNGTSFDGSFINGVNFTVTQPSWFYGYYWWVCPGTNPNPSTATKCALWNVTNGSQSVVSGSVVTSGALSTGWNYIPLTTPVALAPGMTYTAAVGCNPGSGQGFPDTANWWGTNAASGITSGPLFGYGTSGSALPFGPKSPFSLPQGPFSDGGSDPSTTYPGTPSGTDNFWVDVHISNVAPSGASYRIWANTIDAQYPYSSGDSEVAYTLGMVFTLSEECSLGSVWFFSPSGASNLPTEIGVYQDAGAITGAGTLVTGSHQTSVTWSGAAGSGWVSYTYATTPVLAAGTYRVAMYNSGGASDTWSQKTLGYWGNAASGSCGAPGSNGFTNGPLSVPNLASSTQSWEYNSGDSGATPPYSSGTAEAGQSIFAQSGAFAYPALYVDGLAQNYWTDVQVTPIANPGTFPSAALFLTGV